ncbi:preprotein translocase subunit SecA [candidate division WWE3 bacterium]|nr:preprotein translocase subunit SecA [candidate division WWE3 bacterium]
MLEKIFGVIFDTNEKQLKKLQPLVQKVNSHENEVQNWSAQDFKDQTKKWQEQLQQKPYEKQQEILNQILPKAFAAAREAAKRTVEMRPYDVQVLAGIVLHQGKIAEQKTGEGKTLTATMPLYLNALTGKGCHLVTPNDYLSRHGAGWMGSVYNYLGLSVGVIMQEKAFIYDSEYENSTFQDEYAKHLKEVDRKEAYKADVTYGTNHEFGFDYLRDNMKHNLEELVQTNPNGTLGTHNFAIVDEVDSILIDVARTPLIISTSYSQPTSRYQEANNIVKGLLKGTDYEVDEKYRSSTLTELGIRKVEKLLGVGNLYEEDFEMVHLIEQALIANTLYEKDTDYVVKDGQVVIVDQFTGRLLPSNRYSHGLHQAIEAKEGVAIQEESRTLAEISYQNYFRMYSKLAGMTGTAATEAEEFKKIYDLDVVIVPTHRPIARKDHNDVVYKTISAKFKAVADEIEERHNKGQPVLVGTTSVEKSQLLHNYLVRKKISHEILNAKNHEREALIIAQAGKPGAVTVSTNMAGRGVDIILGGDPSTDEEQEKVKELGGLHVIGTERHESRRIDNQLRGRSGRQGDPGSSRFFVSLQDDLMRIFGGARVEALMNRFGLDENVPLEAGMVSKAIENAQKKVEGFNFDRRKSLVEMDDVMNVHREVVYKLRRRILELASGDESHVDWFLQELAEKAGFDAAVWEEKKSSFVSEHGLGQWREVLKQLTLPVVDLLWMEHLVDMDQLKEGIGLRGYAQRDPMVEYKKEGHARFEVLVRKIYASIADRLERFRGAGRAEDSSALSGGSRGDVLERSMAQAQYTKGDLEAGVSDEAALVQQGRGPGSSGGSGSSDDGLRDRIGRNFKVKKVSGSSSEDVGRNDPCPCGSGKKYKYCCGKN